MEPSVAEVPTIFGPNYKNFDEAVEIINNKSGFCIKNGREFIESLDSLLSDEKKLFFASASAKELITKNSGASSKIVEEILAN
jgi:3-deoxy-D-manno-octulosonic-acid transferase